MIYNLQRNIAQRLWKPTLRTILACFVLTMLPAVAQEATNAASQLKPTVVTGSLIPTYETITPTPVDVYTAEQVAKAGVTTVSDLIRQFPSVSGSANFSSSDANGGDGTGGVNLRGILGGTLVLINGRRLAPNELNGRGNVDINAIPLAAIDHIEVLKDGASAIYGADAVAGVV